MLLGLGTPPCGGLDICPGIRLHFPSRVLLQRPCQKWKNPVFIVQLPVKQRKNILLYSSVPLAANTIAQNRICSVSMPGDRMRRVLTKSVSLEPPFRR
ncbi:MAG TPA: hypothetical protein PKH28_10805 [Candidatus Competibacteraceae bacterium]|nr:hypothetical protein [Candidatus Competibacteraceae bacterium]